MTIIRVFFEGEKKIEDFKGKYGQLYILNDGRKKELYIGLGKKKEFSWRRFFFALQPIGNEKKVELVPHPKLDSEKQIYYFTEAAYLFSWNYSLKTEDDRKKKKIAVKPENKRGKIYAEAQNYAREIANTPPNIATPEWIVKKAKVLAKEKRLSIEVFDKKKLQKLGFNLFLAVNQGSNREAYMVHLVYKPKKKRSKIALVGKGLTFDAGGLDIKPAKYMYNMHMDKSGAAVVLGVMKGICELQPEVEVHGFLGLTENSVDANAVQPNSVIKSYSGKTVEIVHTDAEGRLVLADILSYVSRKIKPNLIIDVATLTGAMSVCLGKYATGLFSNDDKVATKLLKAGIEECEYLWRFPLFPEYKEYLKSKVADIKNIGDWGGEAGSITAAKFLEEFVETKWAHLDIASTMLGFGALKELALAPNVRTLLRFIEGI